MSDTFWFMLSSNAVTALPFVMVVRPPERREVPAEVQFEVARNAVTHTADPGAARPLTGPSQGREEHVVARLELGSCRRPEPTELGLRRG